MASAPGGYDASSSADGSTVPPGYTNDTAQSGTLTSYLQSHRLPLVGAQVLTDRSGDQQIILYGFVATEFGKRDAADKARLYLHNPDAPVINRIAVRPELASGTNGSTPGTSGGTSGSASGSSGNGLGTMQSYQDQEQQAQQQQQYMQNSQPSPSALSAIMPLIGMMGLLSMGSGSVGIGGGGFGMGGGSYPPTYGSPYGSPYGNSPYGSPYSPYGGAPYGYGGSTYSPYGGAGPYAPSYGYPGGFP